MKSSFLKAGVAAAALALPMSANALSIEIDAGGDGDIDETVVVAGTSAGFSGTVTDGALGTNAAAGSWFLDVDVSSASPSGFYLLSSQSLNTSGLGELVVTITETYNTFGPILNADVGAQTSFSQAVDVTVQHMVDVGSGFVALGSLLDFDGESFATRTSFGAVNTPNPTLALKTVYTIFTEASKGQSVNVQADIVGNVPVPAAGLLLLAGLGGLGAMKRRKS